MASPSYKVEIGFDLTANGGGSFFTLDDATRGVLDGAFRLGGLVFYDVTSDVYGVSINRGKNRFDDSYSAGISSIQLNNLTRKYDPTYAASPYYGQIIPKRAIRISANNIVQFTGQIDDWNMSYSPDNDSRAVAAASDGFGVFTNQTLTASTAVSQSSGARINAILDSADVNWSASKRSIDTGLTTLGADTIAADTNVLDYLQTIERTEQGDLFVNKSGNLRFIQRNTQNSTPTVTFADDGTGIQYQDLQVVYGSELLFNQVVVNNFDGTKVVADDFGSQAEYGVSTATYSTMLFANTSDAVNMAYWTVAKYSKPRYRFDALTIVLEDCTLAEQNQLFGIELGDTVLVKFTPSYIPPTISRYAEVIGIQHSGKPGESMITFTLATLGATAMVLDDAVFGKLDSDNSLSY